MKIVRRYAAALALLATAGCATQWAPPRGVDPSEFTQQSARCDLAARSGGGFMFAAGRPAFVAGSMLGYGIGQAIRVHRNYVDCMEISGWTPLRER